MPAIHFETTLYTIGSWIILRLPKEASAKLPSRGQVMVEGTINGVDFETPLEPDGNWSHWFRPDNALLKSIHASAGDTVTVEITPTRKWPEPKIPEALQHALETHSESRATWERATPMAHWEWIRWIRSTGHQETREHRLEVACDKLRKGERRPCCWNRNLSTEPTVSKNGVLLEPSEAKNK